jgi:hypothetical protein
MTGVMTGRREGIWGFGFGGLGFWFQVFGFFAS